jgi:DNA ligase-1
MKPFKNVALTGLLSRKELLGLEGELTYGEINTQATCRTTTSCANTIKGTVDGIRFLVFDDHSTPHLSYCERYYAAHQRVEALPDDLKQYVSIIPCTIIESSAQAQAAYQAALDCGYEGLILRDPAAPYKYGRATLSENSYLRMKPTSDAEAVVLSLVEAEANNNVATINELGHTTRSSHQENKAAKGMIGALVCRDLATGDTITVGAGTMTHEERTLYWQQPDLIIGKLIKYKFLDTGIKDKPRHPRFIGFRLHEDMS